MAELEPTFALECFAELNDSQILARSIHAHLCEGNAHPDVQKWIAELFLKKGNSDYSVKINRRRGKNISQTRGKNFAQFQKIYVKMDGDYDGVTERAREKIKPQNGGAEIDERTLKKYFDICVAIHHPERA